MYVECTRIPIEASVLLLFAWCFCSIGPLRSCSNSLQDFLKKNGFGQRGAGEEEKEAWQPGEPGGVRGSPREPGNGSRSNPPK